MEKIEQKFSGHLCSVCGGPAPDWKCPLCGKSSHIFDARHFASCEHRGTMQSKCAKCEEAESKCVCL